MSNVPNFYSLQRKRRDEQQLNLFSASFLALAFSFLPKPITFAPARRCPSHKPSEATK
jgi:hypothetical protein